MVIHLFLFLNNQQFFISKGIRKVKSRHLHSLIRTLCSIYSFGVYIGMCFLLVLQRAQLCENN